MSIEKLAARLREFADERDWKQFHSPKNLAMALGAEAGELLELFQWLTQEQSSAVASDAAQRARAEEELADVFIYLVRLADILDIDLVKAAHEKIETNAQKYPIDKARGRATKYKDL